MLKTIILAAVASALIASSAGASNGSGVWRTAAQTSRYITGLPSLTPVKYCPKGGFTEGGATAACVTSPLVQIQSLQIKSIVGVGPTRQALAFGNQAAGKGFQVFNVTLCGVAEIIGLHRASRISLHMLWHVNPIPAGGPTAGPDASPFGGHQEYGTQWGSPNQLPVATDGCR